MHVGSRQEGAPEPFAPIVGEDGNAKFGKTLAARQMPDPGEAQVIVEDSKNYVAIEIQAYYVVGDALIRQRYAKSQSPVIGFKRDEVLKQNRLSQAGQFLCDNVHVCPMKVDWTLPSTLRST